MKLSLPIGSVAVCVHTEEFLRAKSFKKIHEIRYNANIYDIFHICVGWLKYDVEYIIHILIRKSHQFKNLFLS